MRSYRLHCWCLLLILIAGLTGCGFHLRGGNDLPSVMQRTYLNIPSGNSDLLRELRRNLSSDRIQIVDNPKDATATINVISAQSYRRILSVNNIGRPVEEEVAYQIQFTLTTPTQTLLAPQTLLKKRNYAFDELNALGNAENAAVLNAALQREMAQLILFRIAALKHHPNRQTGN